MVSFILTYRSGGIHRERNLQCCLSWIDSVHVEKEILIVEQNAVPQLSVPALHAPCRIVHAFNDGLFNRSWGFNVGARLARYDRMIFTDSDLLLPEEQLLSAIAALSTTEAVNPYTAVLDLTEEASIQLQEGERSLATIPSTCGMFREGLNFSGGMLLITRAAFDRSGGWPEYIRGWGREDNILSEIIATKLTHETRPGTAFHLYHPTEGLSTHKYSELNTWFLEHPTQRPVGSIGNPNKYRDASWLTEWIRDFPHRKIISSYYHYQMISHAQNRQSVAFLKSLGKALLYHPFSRGLWTTCFRYITGKIAS
jgi:hypothetical protein